MDEELYNELHYTKERIEISILYHRKRERFFALCDRVAKACALVSGTAAFQALRSSTDHDGNTWALVIVLAFTLPSLLSLCFGWGDMARKHASLAESFSRLIASISGTCNPTEKDLHEWNSQIGMIEAGEPAALTCLVSICQNQIAIAAGQFDKVSRLKWYQRWFAHFFDFSITTEQAPKT